MRMCAQFTLRNSAINPFNVIQLLNSEKIQQNEKHFNIHYRDHHVCSCNRNKQCDDAREGFFLLSLYLSFLFFQRRQFPLRRPTLIPI
jgi:hypothetical protein